MSFTHCDDHLLYFIFIKLLMILFWFCSCWWPLSTLIKATSDMVYSCGSHTDIRCQQGTINEPPSIRLIKSHHCLIPQIFDWITSQGTQTSDQFQIWTGLGPHSENVYGSLCCTDQICAVLLVEPKDGNVGWSEKLDRLPWNSMVRKS